MLSTSSTEPHKCFKSSTKISSGANNKNHHNYENSLLYSSSSPLATLRLDASSEFRRSQLPVIATAPLLGSPGTGEKFLASPRDRNMTNPLGATLRPPSGPEDAATTSAASLGGAAVRPKQPRASRLDKIQAQFRQRLESDKETKLLEIHEKHRENLDRRIERITGGRKAYSTQSGAEDSATAPDRGAGMMREFFKERRAMASKAGDDHSALPLIQAHLKRKQNEFQRMQQRHQELEQNQQQQQQGYRQKPPRQPQIHHRAPVPTRNRPLSPIVNNNDNKHLNSTYNLGTSAQRPTAFPPSPSSPPSGSMAPVTPHSPTFEPPRELRQFSVAGGAGNLPPAALPPVNVKGRHGAARENYPDPREMAVMSKKPIAGAVEASSEMTQENRKYLNKIIKTGRQRSAKKRQVAAAAAAAAANDADASSIYGKETINAKCSQDFDPEPSARDAARYAVQREALRTKSIRRRSSTPGDDSSLASIEANGAAATTAERAGLRQRATPARVKQSESRKAPSKSAATPTKPLPAHSAGFREEEEEEEEDYRPVGERRLSPAPQSSAPLSLEDGAAPPPALSLAPCRNCGRRFAEDRLAKHENACVNQKTRKQFDTKRHRVLGQEHEKYALNAKYQKDEPKKNNNWRAKREDFIQNIRYARRAGQTGADAATLPPPPPAANPDYVPCPHCGRRFNEAAAERHIPRCQDLKTKAVGQRSGRGGNTAKTLVAPPSKTRRR